MNAKKRFHLLNVAILLLPSLALAQKLSSADQKIVDAARSRYYSLPSSGFNSLGCAVKFDWTTVPAIPLSNAAESRALLQSGDLTLRLDIRGRPDVKQAFPAGTSEQQITNALPLTNILKSLVGGVFQTWPTKGLQGPVPPSNSEIESVLPTTEGFDFSLRVPGSPVHVYTDKEYLVLKITSLGGGVVESPTYTPSPDGLIFTGNHAVDTTQPGTATNISYEIGVDVVEGLRIPSSVHLKVSDNIDVRYKLANCIVQKGRVIKVAPPTNP